MATTADEDFVTLGVSSDLRETLRSRRDELGYNSYDALLRDMNGEFDPEDNA